MSLVKRQSRDFLFPPQPLPSRVSGNRGGIVQVTSETAKRHSAVWACLNLRAGLLSTLPLINTRTIDGLAVTIPSPRILTLPGGERCDIHEWLYSSDWDLNEIGNTFGIIREVSGYGLPTYIELVDPNSVTVRVRDGKLQKYRIGQKYYDPELVWHEKKYTQSGMHVGLSPIAYAAMSISEYLSAQQFALDWYSDGGIPAARLKNVQRTIEAEEAATVKRQFKQSVANRDIFVHGADWDYEMLNTTTSNLQYLDDKRVSVLEVCRYLGVPSDMIDGESLTKGAIKYTNITQRNLDFLVIHFQPDLVRREAALGRALPNAQAPKFDSDALLRLDPAVLAAMLQARINARMLTVDEARTKYYNLPPLTSDQVDQFATLFPGGIASEPSELTSTQPPA